jgi:hypothetical protein
MQQAKITENNSESEPTASVLALSVAVPMEEMPSFLQERMDASPGFIRLEEVRALDPESQKQVLAVVERAISHYREASTGFRSFGNPAQESADHLQVFLDAARE